LLSACNSARVGAATSPMNDRPAKLQLTVTVPPSMNLLLQEDVAEAFAYRVSAALHEQGLRGRIRYVDRGDALAPEVPELAVMLREWRVDRLGSVNCIFTADLKTRAGERRLGIFSGTSMMTWSRRDWFERQQGFEDAAQDALDNLGRKLKETGLLTDIQFR
jgi:hypothetical protein